MSAPVQEGDVLANKYRVERVLGAGGMGVVVAAQHLQLGQRVALKFLLPEACQHPGAVERFLREARACVQIRSQHVARVSDVGTLETGLPYMVMEYLQGSDLAALLVTHGRLPVAEAVGYLLQACEAIAEAHSLGIVHRDLKPANLFLTRHADGSALIKVLDFGISKALTRDGGASSSATATSAVMGSPRYMSPEQVRSSKNVDARTDVWALGIILHELLTGQAVFAGDTMPGVLAAVIADPPAPLRSHWPEAPIELERIILRCLEKDCARRYQSVAEVANALVPFAPPGARASIERISRVLAEPPQAGPEEPSRDVGGRTATLPPAFVGAWQSDPGFGAVRSSSGTQTAGAWGNTARLRSGRRPVYWIALAAGLAVAAFFAIHYLPSANPPQTSAVAAPAPAPPAPAVPATAAVLPLEQPASEPSTDITLDAGSSPLPERVKPAVLAAPLPATAAMPTGPRPRVQPPRTSRPAPASSPTPASPGTTDYDHF